MPARNRWGLPDLGFGIGLRREHYVRVIAQRPEVDWLEITPEHVLDGGALAARDLERIAAETTIALHGLSMSIGSTDALDFAYLAELGALAERTHATWISDHLGWTGAGGISAHSILPLPYSEHTLAHVVERARAAAEMLQRPLLLENPASFLAFASSTMPEQEFVARLAEEADCGILLDLCNLHVSHKNRAVDAELHDYLDALPEDRIVAIHLAGHEDLDTHSVATRDRPVGDQVWDLYRAALRRFGPRAVAIQCDAPDCDVAALVAEAARARAISERITGEGEAGDAD